MRLALGVRYRGTHFQGWQSQPSGATVQDVLEHALGQFATVPVRTHCAGRTDAGVHGLNQVVHFDAPVEREPFSWVRGTNRYLPADVAVQWCVPVADTFHARNSAQGRRYRYRLLQSVVRPSIEAGLCGWVFQPLNQADMEQGASYLLGEHDFTSFRAAQCQAISPVKHLRELRISRQGDQWLFDFEASAFLHHMVRNIMGCLVFIGQGRRSPQWMLEVLQARSRLAAAPTFAPDGLYFVGPIYAAEHGLPSLNPEQW
jgi:tRNA pseudouridine38-40 synthase